MNDDLLARFLPRFVESASQRLARTKAATDLALASSELRVLASEASFFGLDECARLARQADRHARAGEGRTFKESVGLLEKAIQALGE